MMKVPRFRVQRSGLRMGGILEGIFELGTLNPEPFLSPVNSSCHIAGTKSIVDIDNRHI